MTGLQPGVSPQRGFFGVVFGMQSSSSFFVAQWKYAGPNNVDSVPDGAGLYGTALGATGINYQGQQVFYSTAGLVLKRYD